LPTSCSMALTSWRSFCLSALADVRPRSPFAAPRLFHPIQPKETAAGTTDLFAALDVVIAVRPSDKASVSAKVVAAIAATGAAIQEPILIFIWGMLICSVVEYLASFVMERHSAPLAGTTATSC
jgi:hypothetical protein